MYTFLVVYTKNMYFYFILILSIYKQVGGRGIHRIFKCSSFALQKGSFWKAKRVLLEGKTSPFIMQKESFFTELCK